MEKELSNEKELNKLQSCELFLLDMDGTLYLGDEVFDGAVDFIRTLENSGKDYIYLTNNSSRAGADYVTRLKRLGFPCEERNVFTSGMATAMYLNDNYVGRNVFVMGTKTFYNELKKAGVKAFNATEYDETVRSMGAVSADNLNGDYSADDKFENPVVCVGFDTELVYRDLDLAVHFLRKDAPFIAANPDWVCPMPKGEVLPDCGSMCALLTHSSGKEPTYIGKPNRNMVDIIAKQRGLTNDKICCVGDRLYTDIAVAQNAGSVSVCVLSGECTKEEIAQCDRLPDYTMGDVKELAGYIKR
ncbi:MAG: HAD-IIA family hydrolase [Butyrivibrio sp.]|nr:HAD-IIA family hydrolase [Butyrivibrio sp.]